MEQWHVGCGSRRAPESRSAFSTAFKREVGESPLRYRYRVRDELPARAESLPA